MIKASLLKRTSSNILTSFKNNNLNRHQLRTNSEWSTDFIKKSRPGVEGYDLPPLTQKLNEKVSASHFSKVSSHNFDTHVTKLDDGLRIASEKLFGEFCTVGVIIDAGPRYETTFTSGTTHFIETRI